MKPSLRTALIVSLTVIATVVTINLLTSPGFLWFVFPAFGILWWPLSAYFAGKKQPLAFAVSGAALVAGLLLATYLLASPGAHPWFLYPVLGVIWWPLSAWGAKKGARAFSVAGGLTVILTLLIINLIASPSFWWWVYPAFFILWWPVSVLLGKRAGTFPFALGSAVAASAFLILMYFIQTPGTEPWFLYALLPLFWWPISLALKPYVNGLRMTLIAVVVFAVYYTALIALLHGVSSLLSILLLAAAVWLIYAMGISKHRDSLPFAAVNAALLAAYFIIVHRLVTPDLHPWHWYAFFPLLWWPVSTALKEKAVKPAPVILCAAMFLVYYGALNLYLSPGTPWILFLALPAAAAVIFSLSYQRKAWVALSVWMALAAIAWFAAINLVYTPHAIWAVYPAFALLWWPLSMLLFGRKAKVEETETEL